MGVHTRVGLGAGTIGFALLYLAQPLLGVAAVLLVLVVGALAGLGMAKWLPRSWFGRQLEAGARAGALACGIALAGFMLSLILAGAHATTTLAARSHFVGIDFGPFVRALEIVGWFGVGLALAVVGFGAGTGVAALASQVGAWDKNRHAIEVVKRAREAAQRGGRPGTRAPRTTPNLSASLPPAFGASPPARSAHSGGLVVEPLQRDLASQPSDLEGLNESWHSMRSPLNVFPAPDISEKPWSRYDDRLPPGALLPDEGTLQADGTDENGDASGVPPDDLADEFAADGPSDWQDAAWRSDAGWMDYADESPAPQPSTRAAAPGNEDIDGNVNEVPVPTESQPADEEPQAEDLENVDDDDTFGRSDSWLN